jgi:signal transduction histidine kinase/CheY-like chemotaxis protein
MPGEKTRGSLGIRLIVLILSTTLFLSAVTVTVGYYIYRNSRQGGYIRLGQNLTRTIRNIVDGDSLDRYLSTGITDAAYENILWLIHNIKKENIVQNLYVARLAEEGFYFIYDADDTDDADMLGVFDPFDENYPEFKRQALSGIVDPIISETQWGWLLSVYEPIRNSRGVLVGYVGADFSMDIIMAERRVYLLELAGITLLLTAAFAVLSIQVIRKTIVVPVNAMVKAVGGYLLTGNTGSAQADGDVPSGGTRNEVSSISVLDINTNDELESLVEAMKTMDRKINLTIIELQKAEREAQAASQAKTAFLAQMSHEIRTPMNAILGLSEMTMELDNLPEAVYVNIEKIRISGSSLLSIINDILDLSKIESDKLEITPAVYDLPSLINNTVQINMVRIGDKDIRFMLDVSPDLPVAILGDELRVKQILNNILSNAFKYTQQGLVTMSVSCRDGESGGSDENTMILVFRIADTGQGMKKEDVKKLFNEYARFNLEVNRTTEGTGLGMTITQKLVSLMNGKIEVQTEYGKGSVFTVSVPQGKINDRVIGVELVRDLKDFKFFSGGQAKKENKVREYMPYGSVLVVDDVNTNLYVAKGLMAPYGLKIEIVLSGQEALDKIRSGGVYDVIFMDHMMPVMDGIETTMKIRESGYKGTIIALTANAVSGEKEKFLQSGFDDFISKPIDTRQLDSSLNKWIKDKHSPEEIERARALEPGRFLEPGKFLEPGGENT